MYSKGFALRNTKRMDNEIQNNKQSNQTDNDLVSSNKNNSVKDINMSNSSSNNNSNSDSENRSSEKTIIKHLIVPKNKAMINSKKRKADEAASDGTQARNKQPNRSESARQRVRPTTPTNMTPVSNRFEPLQEQKDDAYDGDLTPLTRTKRPRAPAPIIIAGDMTSHTEFVNSIKRSAKGDFHVKYTANNINLYLEKETDKKELVKAFTK